MIISGKELSAQLKDEMKAQVATFPEKYGRVPHLVVILVGEDPGSVSYVTGKAKASEYVGIKNTTIRKPDTITETELLDLIEELNADDSVDGILVQLPLPKHISEDKVIATIAKEKDVDGFHIYDGFLKLELLYNSEFFRFFILPSSLKISYCVTINSLL